MVKRKPATKKRAGVGLKRAGSGCGCHKKKRPVTRKAGTGTPGWLKRVGKAFTKAPIIGPMLNELY
jgi:hypothetical protein